MLRTSQEVASIRRAERAVVQPDGVVAWTSSRGSRGLVGPEPPSSGQTAMIESGLPTSQTAVVYDRVGTSE